ncbi:magnesium transporter [Dysgonomonas sp. PFB1-18]|uniref:magnesium transporter n=1 Tax=unclassified Dysgonomonas TaxID=2630389 RepID=UPI002476D8CE|nr:MULTISPECIES: magnesium transporter [unclassified Dysgonomonas]MDH6309092.1 magnesium transporter [Dysgonomonas sp. PF1-14]MDH6339028.1 magnesium transporter [Dysgonomonas sp. PF1-16]MDH6380341.1 magnesium transporter [Dysgonomonas sp. PFB1-18]MDH6397856.1 magnesium transporter [Dysgonomonas sp. PF1-23]
MKENIELLTAETKLLLETGDISMLRMFLDDQNISDVEDLIDELPDYAPLFIDTMSIKRAINVFRILDAPTQERIAKKLTGNKIAEIVNGLPPDDRTSFLGELRDQELQHRLISLLTPEDRKEVFMLLSYPEDSIGRMMTPDFLAISKDYTVEEALKYIRHNGKNSETIDVIYILDEKGALIDDLRIRELLINDPQKKISELIDGRLIYLNAQDPLEEGIKTFKMNNRVALPVIDSAGLLLGIVTIDDILWAADEEYAEDMQRMGGTAALDEPYLDLPVYKLIWKRAGWLIVLFVGELLTASVMQHYEEQLAQVIVLALFLPLMISSGGNSGSQASTLVIQAMATGEVKLKDWWRVFRREVISGLSLGIILGVIGFFRIYIWHLIFPSLYGEHWTMVGSTVSLALVGIVLWGSLIGSMLPFILRRLGADPATSSAPFVATIVDVTGLIIYLTIASWIFGPLMNG